MPQAGCSWCAQLGRLAVHQIQWWKPDEFLRFPDVHGYPLNTTHLWASEYISLFQMAMEDCTQGNGGMYEYHDDGAGWRRSIAVNYPTINVPITDSVTQEKADTPTTSLSEPPTKTICAREPTGLLICEASGIVTADLDDAMPWIEDFCGSHRGDLINPPDGAVQGSYDWQSSVAHLQISVGVTDAYEVDTNDCEITLEYIMEACELGYGGIFDYTPNGQAWYWGITVGNPTSIVWKRGDGEANIPTTVSASH